MFPSHSEKLIVLLCLGVGFLLTGKTNGQAGLRETLEKMDKNQNGYLDPDEVTPLSRPFLERIMGRTSGRRYGTFNERIPISRIQQSARYYFAIKNGVQGTDVNPDSDTPLKDFTLDREDRIVPDFGIAKVKFPYIKADLDEADSTMRRCDRNRDGLIDREEAARNKWTHRNPFDDDLNKDGKLSRLELAQRYARRRLVSNDSGEMWQKHTRTGGEVKPSVSPTSSYNSRYNMSGVAARLSYDLLSRFDRNRNRLLDGDEIKQLGLPVDEVDKNGNGNITREELQQYMAQMQESVKETPENLPTWFTELDLNKNEQIEMVEFTEEWTEFKLREFAAIDLNSDGVLTMEEVVQSVTTSGAQYVSKDAEILVPKKTIISEIEIEEDVKIDEIKVTLSVTHSYISQLDGYLLGPKGERVELFTAVGGSDDHFVNTVFDDKSAISIAKARPPFAGSFRPEGLDKKEPGLAQFKGKSAKGVWQLMIRSARSERYGLLHQWGLQITPAE